MREGGAMGVLHEVRRERMPRVVEAAACALAAAATAVLVAWLPGAQALDALACIRFYLAQGCLP
jgi:hypothetical protein